MKFRETSYFTRWVKDALTDDDYRELRDELTRNPLAGDVIRGGGGIRKIRIALAGKGKRGGARAIYYYAVQHTTILFLYAYEKASQGDVEPDQLKFLRRIVKEEFP